VESNDVLYGGDPDYQQEAQNYIDKLVDHILAHIEELKNSPDSSVSV
jgi:transcription termination factor NusB